ncbi:flavin-containing monooxygenase [Exophiala viscosa]|uniref:flavin-containing monooxygenase n=1 Tax=Exophiala viscosa TaxID=2486360 RepID=UPI0021922859|nr:flavin-containing monooxygenase [Exophiala viscosa]
MDNVIDKVEGRNNLVVTDQENVLRASKEKAAFKRTPKFPLENVPGKLPHARIPDDVDVASVAAKCVSNLNTLQSSSFADGAIWRDLYALTGLPRTFFERTQILPVWKEVGAYQRARGFSLVPGTARVISFGPEIGWIQASYRFETSGIPAAMCSGLIGVIPDEEGQWKIWLLTTVLEHLRGFPSPDRFPQASDANYDVTQIKHSDPYECVVVGAGFAGLCMSGRLKALHVRYLTLERNARVGDNWMKRYDSLKFHTGRDLSNFPMDRIFTEDDPYHLTREDLARGYETFANRHELNIRTKSTLKAASYNKEQEFWTLQVVQDDEEVLVKTRHLVFAMGSAGTTPVMPQLKGRELFKGTAIHSVEYSNSDAFGGKKGVVVGTANSGHDVADDMLRAGLSSVTMIQRGKTQIYPAEYNSGWSDPIYNKHVPIEVADRAAIGLPNSIIRQMNKGGYKKLSAQEPERYAAVEKAGFRIEKDVDIWPLLCGKQGGHYVDVGTSKKIGDGLIKIKNDASLVGFTESGLLFDDGSTLEADFVVFCTGFANDARDLAIDIVGPEVGELLDDYYFVDDEGEIRGAWKPQGRESPITHSPYISHDHPGIWYTGGGVPFARFFSRFLALQIKADIMGTPLKLYRKKGSEITEGRTPAYRFALPQRRTGSSNCI